MSIFVNPASCLHVAMYETDSGVQSSQMHVTRSCM
jgi:hypothetical protein